MFSTTRITSIVVASLALCCLTALPIFAGKPPNGGGGGTTEIPNSPTVQYRATYLDAPASFGAGWSTVANDMNELLGTIVGDALSDTKGMRAVMWLPDGTAIDLNYGATWIDASTGDPALGWTAIRGSSINLYNQVVGVASASTSAVERAYVYDSTNGFVLLPVIVGQTTVVTYGTYDLNTVASVDINDSGVIACQVNLAADTNVRAAIVYTPQLYQPLLLPPSALNANTVGANGPLQINNLGTITDRMGVVYPPYTQDKVLDLGSSGYRIRGLADNSDVVCGQFVGQGNGKNAIPAGAVRVDLSSSPADVFLWRGQQYGGGNGFDRVNDQGDMWFWGADVVYKEAWSSYPAQLLSLRKNEIVNWKDNKAIEIAKLTNSNTITDPDSTGHGAMCGTSSSPYRAFVIFPEKELQP